MIFVILDLEFKIMALYHLYRPQKFSDIVGQDHIVKILTNGVKLNRLTHAYLFCGPRGLGKTSLARILAKVVNCENPPANEPCDNCPSCQQIISGRSLDVIEIDAASNRGIDEIRELRDKARFSPTDNRKKKIFIVDEVHMLTKEAFNALLKILEEPPAHIIFILATTEAHKIPVTVLSRVQRHDFKRAIIADLTNYLRPISQKEKISIDDDGLKTISQLADGSFRDALMLLDQLRTTTAKEKLTTEIILKNLGLARIPLVKQFIQLLDAKDSPKLFQLLEKLQEEGVDFNVFTKNIIEQLAARMKTRFQPQDLQWIKIFLNVLEQIKYAPISSLPLELAVFEICGANISVSHQPPASVNPQPSNSNPSPSAVKFDWPKIVSEVKKTNTSLAAILETAAVKTVNQNELVLAVKFKFHKERMEQAKNLAIIEQAMEKSSQTKLRLKCEVDEEFCQNLSKNKEEELAKVAEEIF